MSFISFENAILTPRALGHILHGDPADESHGGHRSGSDRPGKTEFPLDWSDEQIELAILSVCRAPHSVRELGARVVLQKNVSGVVVEVWLLRRTNGVFVQTGFPIFGPSVERNTFGVKTDLQVDQRDGKF